MSPNTFTNAVHHKEKNNQKSSKNSFKYTCLKQGRKYYFNFLVFSRPLSQKSYLLRSHDTLISLDQALISPSPRKLHVGKRAKAWRRGGGPRPRRVSGPAPGQVAAGWGRGFVLQFRACRAEGGNRQPGPSYSRPGRHPRIHRTHSPSSRT